jgi:hypothetical protein
MRTDQETTRIVRSWLEEGVTALPDRVLDAALDQLPATPQRRSWWPARRFATMHTYAKLAIAAAAVLVVAVVGYQFLPRTGGVGGQPTPAPSPTIVPSPSSSIVPLLPGGELLPGTYRLVSFTNQPLTLNVPATGWAHADGNFITKGDAWDGNGVTLATWQVSHIYSDSCDWEGTLVPVDTARSIVAALVVQQGHTTSEPSDTTLGGQPATRIELSLDPSFDVATCDRSIVRLWPDAGPREQYGLPIYPGQTTVVHVVDHSDSATLVVSIQNDDSAPDDVTEMDAILASIQFTP